MQTSDGPTNPRTRRVLKNRQVNSGSVTPHTVSPMQHLQAVVVKNSKPLGFCFGEQESEPYPRTQMSDRPAHSSNTRKFFRIIVTHYFTRSKLAGALGRKSSSSLVFQYLYNIIQHILRNSSKNVTNDTDNNFVSYPGSQLI